MITSFNMPVVFRKLLHLINLINNRPTCKVNTEASIAYLNAAGAAGAVVIIGGGIGHCHGAGAAGAVFSYTDRRGRGIHERIPA